MKYEFSPVPFAIFHSDGCLRKNTKSVLLAELENDVAVQSRIPLDITPLPYVVDGMTTIQMVKNGGAATFGDFADKYWDIFTLPLNNKAVI